MNIASPPAPVEPAAPFMPRRGVIVAVVAATAALTTISATFHVASVGPLLAFHFVCITVIALTLPRPRSQAYTAIAVMFVLGFWPKFMLRLFVDMPYLEPTGNFDHAAPTWNAALVTAVLGMSGVAAVRLIHLVYARRGMSRVAIEPQFLQGFYERYRAQLWWISIALIAAAYAWNVHAAVYIVGVNPRVVLPFRLNIVLAWCYLVGFPLWLALLIGWEMRRRRTSALTGWMLFVAAAEGMVSSVLLLSRANYLLRAAAYMLAVGNSKVVGRRVSIGPNKLLVAAGVVAGFAVSIVAVMLLRAVIYYDYYNPPARSPVTTTAPRPSTAPSGPPATQPSVLAARPIDKMVQEVGRLFIDRWIGLEGVMAVASSPRSPDVLWKAVSEDPHLGITSQYQQIALASRQYEAQKDFTFLTLAGIIAVFAMAGLPWLTVVGTGALTALLMLSETVTRRLTGNEMAVGIVSTVSAFMLVQVTFPRLFATFLLEMWLTLGALALLSAMIDRMWPRKAHQGGS